MRRNDDLTVSDQRSVLSFAPVTSITGGRSSTSVNGDTAI